MLFPNPLELVTQLLTVVALGIIIVFGVKYRSRVMVAITGDDRLHGDPLDCVWWCCFRCCGTCEGDWTRFCTLCACCPTRWRNCNVINVIGRWFGVYPYAVEIKNIVIGDLPWPNRADFYIQVECAANPPMVTALAEEKLPKVVHFPEIITLRIRWSLLEEQVKITVRELNVLGSTDICYCYIPAMSLIDWAGSPKNSIKRIEMKTINSQFDHETPAWILLETTLPMDDRDLDNFHAASSTVRTTKRSEGFITNQSVGEFKHEYALLDASGHVMPEPDEDDLRGIECIETVTRQLFRFVLFWGVVILIGPTVISIWAFDCYRRYRWITISHLLYPEVKTFSYAVLKNTARQCHFRMDGTGTPEGKNPCRPSGEEVIATCHGPNSSSFPADQPAVGAFPGLFRLVTGNAAFIPCPVEACEIVHYHRADSKIATFGGWGFFVFLLVFIKFVGYRCVVGRRLRLQEKQAAEAKEVKLLTRTNRGRRGEV